MDSRSDSVVDTRPSPAVPQSSLPSHSKHELENDHDLYISPRGSESVSELEKGDYEEKKVTRMQQGLMLLAMSLQGFMTIGSYPQAGANRGDRH